MLQTASEGASELKNELVLENAHIQRVCSLS